MIQSDVETDSVERHRSAHCLHLLLLQLQLCSAAVHPLVSSTAIKAVSLSLLPFSGFDVGCVAVFYFLFLQVVVFL